MGDVDSSTRPALHGRSFDEYRDSYRAQVEQAIGFAGKGLDFFASIKAGTLLELAQRYVGDPKRLTILDIGCGIGFTDRFLIPSVRAVHGVDTSRECIDAARHANPGGEYRVYEGTELPYDDASFDVTFVFNVIHHVHMPDRQRFIREMSRVTRPGGLVVAIEQNPLNPLTRLAVARCSFDDGCELARRRAIEALFKGTDCSLLESRYVLFFPWAGRIFRWIERGLRHVPFGAQYLVVGQRGPN